MWKFINSFAIEFLSFSCRISKISRKINSFFGRVFISEHILTSFIKHFFHYSDWKGWNWKKWNWQQFLDNFSYRKGLHCLINFGANPDSGLISESWMIRLKFVMRLKNVMTTEPICSNISGSIRRFNFITLEILWLEVCSMCTTGCISHRSNFSSWKRSLIFLFRSLVIVFVLFSFKFSSSECVTLVIHFRTKSFLQLHLTNGQTCRIVHCFLRLKNKVCHLWR